MKKLELLVKTKDNYHEGHILGWNYYIDTNGTVYSIAKDGNTKRNSYFGDLRHTLYRQLNTTLKDKIQINVKYKDEVENLVKRRANKLELDNYNNLVEYITV